MAEKPQSLQSKRLQTCVEACARLTAPGLLTDSHPIVRALRSEAENPQGKAAERALLRCADREASLLWRTALEAHRRLPKELAERSTLAQQIRAARAACLRPEALEWCRGKADIQTEAEATGTEAASGAGNNQAALAPELPSPLIPSREWITFDALGWVGTIAAEALKAAVSEDESVTAS